MAEPSVGASPVPYRGEDRRRIAGPVQPPVGRTFVVAGSVVLCLWAALTFLVNISAGQAAHATELVHLLQVASFMTVLAVGALAISRWYLTSDVPALWVGVALLLIGVVRIGLVELLPWIVPESSLVPVVSWLRPASQLVAALLLIRAVRTSPVDADVSAPRLIAGTIVGVGALTFLLQFVPGVATFVDGAGGEGVREYVIVNEVGIMAAVWGVLGAAFTWRGHQRHRWLFSWLGLMLLALALGDVTRVIAPPPTEAGLLGKEILRLVGVVAGLNGAFREILYTYRDSSTRLARSEYTALTAQERIREGQAAAEERAHEARSALAAIEGATRTLEHYRDRLPAETQSALSTAISGEIRRLQRLVSVEEPASELTTFSLAEALAPLVASERARGVDVDVDVAGDLDAQGRAGSTEQVLQTLFDNARRYAPGAPVTVRAQRDGEWITVRVEDCGPGVPADQHEAVFRRGVRGAAAADVPGSGLGLYVAAQLMRDQGGELWVDDRPGGGASFGLTLAAAGWSGVQEPVDGLDDDAQVWDDGRLRAVRRGH